MRQNNILTYLLYLLLAGLIVAAGYKACQIKKDKQLEREKQEAELQKALNDMGYTSTDTTAGSGSTYSDKTEPETTTTTSTGKTSGTTNPSNSGIEDEQDPTPAKSTAATSKTAATTKTAPATQPTTASQNLAKASAATSKSASKGIAASNKNAKFRVQAGSFTKMEGARRRLEEVIKAGYPNAEIGKTNNGKFAVVIVYRTNSKADAINVADKLEAKGIDATVMSND